MSVCYLHPWAEPACPNLVAGLFGRRAIFLTLQLSRFHGSDVRNNRHKIFSGQPSLPSLDLASSHLLSEPEQCLPATSAQRPIQPARIWLPAPLANGLSFLVDKFFDSMAQSPGTIGTKFLPPKMTQLSLKSHLIKNYFTHNIKSFLSIISKPFTSRHA